MVLNLEARGERLLLAAGAMTCLTVLQDAASSCWEEEGTAHPWPHKAHFMADELWQDRESISYLFGAPGDNTVIIVVAGYGWDLNRS